MTRITDNLGRETEFSYDLMNQEIKRRERDGGITRTVYDRNGNPVKIIRPNQYAQYGENGSGIQYIYDSLDQITTVINADGRIQETYAYDKVGNLREKLDGNGNRGYYTYDLSGHYTYVQTSGNATQQYEYDPYGNITGIVDGEGNHTVYGFDEWGRIVEIKRADGESEFYRYDYAGNITKSVDANGNATLYEYNCIGKMAKMTDPLGYSEHYYYDVGNRLCHMVDRNGTETTYGYNLYNSLTERRAKNPSAEKMECCDYYKYTPEGLLKSAISAGNAKGISNMGMRYSYEYDVMGRLVRKSASGRTLLSYGYDLNGNLIWQEDVTGKVTEYTYNALDLLETVEDNGNKVASYVYYADGTVKNLKSGSLYTEYAYDADRNLTGLKTLLGTEVLTDNHYCYDHNGNRTEKQQIGGITRYTYDTLNQLTKVQYPSYTKELFYDRAGNRTQRKTDKVEELYSYAPRNRLTEYKKGGNTTNFTYDNAGNLLSDNKAQYTYDAFNHMERVETFDGHVQINRYDAEGLRHEMEEDGKLVQFIFRGDEVVAEEKENNIIRFIRGYELIASDAESARTYYHYASDEMGSITHLVEGNVVCNRYEYDAWGNTTVCEETVENRFRFNGQQYDAITQQYYLRARFYNPVIARFTQEDTYWGDGLNLYKYCRNNPVYYVDPSGYLPDHVKEAYDEIKWERGKDRLVKVLEGYKNAGSEISEDNVFHKPITDWSDAELQWAMDNIYRESHKKYHGNSVLALTISPEGNVILSANSDTPSAKAIGKALELFGNKLQVVEGDDFNDYNILQFNNASHAEARAAHYILKQMGVSAGTSQNLKDMLQGYKQVCSDYSCDKCTEMQQYLGIDNLTGSTVLPNNGKRGKRRLKDEYFLQNKWDWNWWYENIGRYMET